jgi:hypothetical protein
MRFPSIAMKFGRGRGSCASAFCRSSTVERTVHAIDIVLVEETLQLPNGVSSVPEKYVIEILSPYRADQAPHEGMRNRSIRNRLGLLDINDT